MSSQYKFNESENFEELKPHNKVKLTELLSRIKRGKEIRKKRNVALGVAALSAVTVFGIILTI